MKPEVGCGACHDGHIPAPNGNQLAQVNSTVAVANTVTTSTGSVVVTATTPASGRSVSYLNHKPYKINDAGAQDFDNGIWTRGSTIARPTFTLGKGSAAMSSGAGKVADILTAEDGGLVGKVKPGQTVLLTGKASATVNLPADAVNANAPVTVEATFDTAGFEVDQVAQ